MASKDISEDFCKKHEDRLHKYSITLDDLKQNCTQSIAVRIAKNLTEWRIARAFLGISGDVMKKIDFDPKNDEAAKRVHFIEGWLTAYGNKATFLKLFEALDQSERIDLIEEGLQYLQLEKDCIEVRKNDEETDSDYSENVNDEDMMFLCGCGRCSLNSFLENGCPNPWEHAHFPLLNIKEMRRQEKIKLLSRLTQDAWDISESFSSLTISVYSSLKELHDFDVNMLKIFLLTMQKFFYMSEEKRAKLYSDFISNVSEVSAVMMFLLNENYITWFNHYLLGSITKQFKVCEVEYQEYIDKILTPFLQRSLFEIPSDSFNASDDPQGSGHFILKLDVLDLEATPKAEVLLLLRKHVINSFGIAIDAFEFCSYHKGCIEFVLAAPLCLLQKIFPLSDRVLESLSMFNYKGLYIKTVQFDKVQNVPKKVVVKEDLECVVSTSLSTKLTDAFTMFASLIVELYRSIKENEIELQKIKEFLFHLNCQRLTKPEDKPLLHKAITQIDAISTLADLFLFLNQFWSFFNYKLLERFFIEFDSKAKLQSYVSFLEALKVVEVPPLVQPFYNVDCYYSDLLELRMQPNSLQALSTDELLHIQHRVATALSIENYALLLKEIKIVEDKLEYLVPVCVQFDAKRMGSLLLSSLGEEKVIGVSLKNFSNGGILEQYVDEVHRIADIDSGVDTLRESENESHLRRESKEEKRNKKPKFGTVKKALSNEAVPQSTNHTNPSQSDVSISHPHAKPSLDHDHEAMGLSTQFKINSEYECSNEEWKFKFKTRLQYADLQETNVKGELTAHNYKDKMFNLLCFEESEHMTLLSEKCDGEYQLFLKGSEIIEGQEQNVGYIYGMSLDQMQHATQASEGIFIFDKGKNEDNCPAQIFPDNLGNVNGEFMIIIPSSSIEYLKRKFGITERESYQVSVQFEVKHSYFDTLHKAIVKVPEAMIKKIFPKQGDTTQPLPTGTHRVNSKCDDQLEILSIDDYSQLKALESILQSPPNIPVIVSGPFGSGKTRVLARAAYEFVKDGLCQQDPTRILICAHHYNTVETYVSNYLGPAFKGKQGVKIIKLMQKDSFGSISNVISKSVTGFCEDVQHGRHINEHVLVIVTTYTTSLQLLESYKVPFSHILLDEVAQVREPEAICALCLGVSSTKVVIAGDSKQVGPSVAVIGKMARENGLKVSLLERLEKRYEEIGANSHFIQLEISYRCHPSVTCLLSNVLYKYEIQSDIKEQAGAGSYPCFFYCSNVSNDSPTDMKLFMEIEANAVVSKLKEHFGSGGCTETSSLKDVCIVSSFIAQLNYIREKLKDSNFNKVTLLPSYAIQGHEFDVVLVSTYEPLDDNGKSTNPTKTLVDPIIFNTVISHSKQLVIAVGNPNRLLNTEEAMGYDERCWKEYIKLCLEKNTIQLMSAPNSQQQLQKLKETLRIKIESIKKLNSHVLSLPLQDSSALSSTKLTPPSLSIPTSMVDTGYLHEEIKQKGFIGLTIGNYKDTFRKALDAERTHKNVILASKCNGIYDLTVLHLIPKWFQPKSDLDFVAYIHIDDHKFQLALQESEYVHLHYAINDSNICKVKIASQNFRNTKPVLYLQLSTSDKEKLMKYPYKNSLNGEGIVFTNIKFIFDAKIGYYTSLTDAVAQIPDFMIRKILPTPEAVQVLLQKDSKFTCNISRECTPNKLSIDGDDKIALLQHMLVYPADFPIIISGSFGTGKTTLLARAAYELVQYGLSSEKVTRILICSHHSNYANDYMEKYIIPAFENNDNIQIVRIMRKSKEKKMYGNRISSSNIHFMEFVNFEINDTLIQTKCVLFVSTYMTSLKLVDRFKEKFYFTHIILDEAAQVREPEAIAPLCLANKDTKIIMAGDIQQVGPSDLVQATDARKGGLNISLLERLWKTYGEIKGPLVHFKAELYRNYRCHPDITKLLFDLLYYDKGVIVSPKKVVPHPKAHFPCVFYCSDCSTLAKKADITPKQNSDTGLSVKDAEAVVYQLKYYFTKWPKDWKDIHIPMEGSVCVVSASRNQLNKIRDFSMSDWDRQCAVYVPSYVIQGSEYQAVFLSTYESLDENGKPHDETKSLCNPHVFNTAVCRSRALVVAVGDPLKLLKTEEEMGFDKKCWRAYIKYCLANKTFYFPSKDYSQHEKMKMRDVLISL